MRKTPILTRRRALGVFASVGAVAMLGPARWGTAMPVAEWRGRALGGQARMAIRHPDGRTARTLLAFCLDEVERLEKLFSLYRRESEIVRFNRAGRLDDPSHDMRLLLGEALRFGSLSGGAFDVTVQPLWRVYSDHFAGRPEDTAGPDPRIVEQAVSLVDYRGIDLDNGRAVLARPGMQVTLNGLAQGYITDRIAGMLRDAGMTDVLVDLGEIRALDGGIWRVGIADPQRPGRTIHQLSLGGCAVATSAGAGSRFDATGRFHHLFDPATGRCADACLSATAVAPTAMQADALATVLAVSPPDEAHRLLRAFGGSRAIIVKSNGGILEAAA